MNTHCMGWWAAERYQKYQLFDYIRRFGDDTQLGKRIFGRVFGAISPEFKYLKAGSKENAVEPSKFEILSFLGLKFKAVSTLKC